jgi:ankyrin repeat protein
LSGDGNIRYTEFIAATIEAHGALTERRLAEAFDHLDCDDSGFISAENLLEILGEGVSKEEIERIIEDADLTKNGRISYSEFLALWEEKPGVVQGENLKVLESELSTISAGSDSTNAEESDAHAEFLKEKHLQNTLHTWSVEMQLPAQEFAVGCSFLHLAALGNQLDLENLISKRPSLVNFRDYDRRTALHIAASEGHADICRFLIKKGARVNRGDRWGGFPLDDAHRHQQVDVMNLLREHGAKFGSTSKTVNLITAASEGNVDEVRILLEFGSMDLNQGDYDRRTALHLAANEGHLEVVELLCDSGADINVKDRWGDRPLDDAKKAKKNAAALVDILSGSVRGSSVRSASTDQQVASMDALKDQSGKQTTVFVEKNDEMTELPVQEFALGCSVLHQSALGSRLVLEKILLEKPQLVNFRDYDRRTALHIAASEGQLEICQMLVAKGARINRVDRWGGSALDDAHRDRHLEVVKFLREHKAKFGSTSQTTNFITAASEGDTEEVRAFLDFGSIDLNKGDYDRRTALHLAAGEGRLEIVKLLCEAGADVNVEDRWGHRPLDDATSAKENSIYIMKLLSKHGAKSKNVHTTVKTAFLSVFKSGG